MIPPTSTTLRRATPSPDSNDSPPVSNNVPGSSLAVSGIRPQGAHAFDVIPEGPMSHVAIPNPEAFRNRGDLTSENEEYLVRVLTDPRFLDENARDLFFRETDWIAQSCSMVMKYFYEDQPYAFGVNGDNTWMLVKTINEIVLVSMTTKMVAAYIGRGFSCAFGVETESYVSARRHEVVSHISLLCTESNDLHQ
ncbi:hypothetical protein DICA4_E00606 [Diutina catenulata]